MRRWYDIRVRKYAPDAAIAHSPLMVLYFGSPCRKGECDRASGVAEGIARNDLGGG